MSESQVVALFKDTMQTALEDNQKKRTQVAEGGENGNELRLSGVTIDISHIKELYEVPEEVIDIIKHDIHRYCLSCATQGVWQTQLTTPT